jgi:cyclic pyranopterin phosphate synthase
MVDVGGKPVTTRQAVASGRVLLRRETLEAVRGNRLRKGDVEAVARLAGIQAAKEASRLIPLAHPLALEHIHVDVRTEEDPPSVRVTAVARTSARTGVEMEALTAVAVALLAVYDMVKAVDREAVIGEVRLEEKTGGKSGPWRRRSTPGGRV